MEFDNRISNLNDILRRQDRFGNGCTIHEGTIRAVIILDDITLLVSTNRGVQTTGFGVSQLDGALRASTDFGQCFRQRVFGTSAVMVSYN